LAGEEREGDQGPGKKEKISDPIAALFLNPFSASFLEAGKGGFFGRI
jgi:hypothetical protein